MKGRKRARRLPPVVPKTVEQPILLPDPLAALPPAVLPYKSTKPISSTSNPKPRSNSSTTSNLRPSSTKKRVPAGSARTRILQTTRSSSAGPSPRGDMENDEVRGYQRPKPHVEVRSTSIQALDIAVHISQPTPRRTSSTSDLPLSRTTSSQRGALGDKSNLPRSLQNTAVPPPSAAPRSSAAPSSVLRKVKPKSDRIKVFHDEEEQVKQPSTQARRSRTIDLGSLGGALPDVAPPFTTPVQQSLSLSSTQPIQVLPPSSQIEIETPNPTPLPPSSGSPSAEDPDPREGSTIPFCASEMNSSIVLETFNSDDTGDIDMDLFPARFVPSLSQVAPNLIEALPSPARHRTLSPPLPSHSSPPLPNSPHPPRHPSFRPDTPSPTGPSSSEDDIAYYIRTTSTHSSPSSNELYETMNREIGEGDRAGSRIGEMRGRRKGRREVLERGGEWGVGVDELMLG